MKMSEKEMHEAAKDIEMSFSVFMDIYDTFRRITGVVLFVAWFVTWLLGLLLGNQALKVASLVLVITNLFTNIVLLLVTRHFIDKWIEDEENEDDNN